MKKKKVTLILLLIFFLGIFILLYPMISQYWNSRVSSYAVTNYEEAIHKISTEEYNEMRNAANLYNMELRKLNYPLAQYKRLKNYNDLLNVNNNGMMGYISIPKIKVEIPIYHGTSASVLNTAVGHLEGSSLPVGGIGTHSALSAHRGLPSSKLFTDLNKLEIGDEFTITILDQVLTYQVDQIEVVKPSEIKNLTIDADADYVTLLTCTPYGINTHRLLVIGKRIEASTEKQLFINNEAYLIDKLVVTFIISLIIILISMIYISLKPIKKRKY